MKTRTKHLNWFWATNNEAEEWFGPHKFLEDAIKEGLFTDIWDKLDYIYVATGRKALKSEKDSWCEFDYVVDANNALKIISSKTDKMPGNPKVIV